MYIFFHICIDFHLRFIYNQLYTFKKLHRNKTQPPRLQHLTHQSMFECIGQLAVGSWRTRFGRLSNKTELGHVIAGTFCTVPDDWLRKKMGNV